MTNDEIAGLLDKARDSIGSFSRHFAPLGYPLSFDFLPTNRLYFWGLYRTNCRPMGGSHTLSL